MLRYKPGYTFKTGMGNSTIYGNDIYNINEQGVKFVGGELTDLYVGQFIKVGELFIKRNIADKKIGRRAFLISELDPFFNIDKLIQFMTTDVDTYMLCEPARKLFTAYIHNAIEGEGNSDIIRYARDIRSHDK